MLVLSRKVGEEIWIGDEIRVKVVRVHGSRVAIGIEAPEEIKVIRSELAHRGNSGVDDQEEAHTELNRFLSVGRPAIFSWVI